MAQLQFDKNAGITVPTVKTIVDDLGEQFKNIFQSKGGEPEVNIEPTTPLGQIIDAFAAEIASKNAEVAYLAGQSDLNTAEGRWLDALVSLYFLTRKVSEPTVVQCTVKGLNGTFIPYGAIVKDSEGNQYRHNVAAGCRLPSTGEAVTTFASIEHGAFEVAPHSITKIVTVVPGWDSVDNPTGGVTGRVTESDSELRARYRQSVAINSTGNVETIRANVASLPGVIDCAVLENVTNQPVTLYGVEIAPHGIGLCVFGGEDADISRAVFISKMGGTSMSGNTNIAYRDADYSGITYVYRIFRPVTHDFFVRIQFYADAMDEETKTAIKEAVVSDALGLGDDVRLGLAQTVYADRFRDSVFKATSTPVKSIGIALDKAEGWTDRMVIRADVEPSITAANVTIELIGA